MPLSTGESKILTLLTACLPNNQTIKKQLIINDIMEQNEFKAMEKLPCYRHLNKLFDETALKSLPMTQLKKVKTAVSCIPSVIEHLGDAVKSGQAWRLEADDMPDWYSAESLKQFDAKLASMGESENITNITSDQVLYVFTDKVVKSTDELIEAMTVGDAQNVDAYVKKALKGKLYCLPKTPLINQQIMVDQCDEAMNKLAEARKGKRSSNLKEIISLVLCTMVVSLFAPSLLGMSNVGGFFYLIAYLIISSLYIIRG